MTLRPLRVALALALCLAVGLAGPVPAPALFDRISVPEEMELGKQFDQQLRSQLPMIEDPLVTGYVADLVKRIEAVLPPQPFPIRPAVINNSGVNAFAIPGGYIYVFSGLLMAMDDEDEVAGVISHELGHVTEHHVAKRLQQAQIASAGAFLGTIAGALLGVAGHGENMQNASKAVMVGSQAAATAKMLLYSQENEREADHVGMNYLTAAGYNPEGLPDSFEVMMRNKWSSGDSQIPSYLSTHPAVSDRIVYLQERVKRMPPEYLQRRTDNSRFLRVKALLWGRIGDPTLCIARYDDMAPDKRTCLDTMAVAMAADRAHKTALAEQSFQNALACGGSDPLILREAGRFWFKQGDLKKAQPLLQKAMFLAPDDQLVLFYNARLLAEMKEYGPAIETMRQVLRALPREPEVHYHLGRLLGETGDVFGAHVHLAYAALYDMDRRQARFHLDKARGLAQTPDQKQQLQELEQQMGGGGGGGPEGDSGEGPGGGQ
ncbi:MAG: M48 family metalloprotease [Desulfovibrionaceae bacterium]